MNWLASHSLFIYAVTLVVIFPCYLLYLSVRYGGLPVVRFALAFLTFCCCYPFAQIFPIGVQVPGLFIVGFLAHSCFFSSRKKHQWRGGRRWTHLVESGLILGPSLTLLIILAAEWRLQPSPICHLSSPLRGNDYLVLKGGQSTLFNHHRSSPEQIWAIDIIRKFGYADLVHIAKGDLDHLSIFGAPVFSPCNGQVIETDNGSKDSKLASFDYINPYGNSVLIACTESMPKIYVRIAHLKADSLEVASGQFVDTNTILGGVGNSGLTTMPHLHIHAYTTDKVDESFVYNRGLAIAIEGSYNPPFTALRSTPRTTEQVDLQEVSRHRLGSSTIPDAIVSLHHDATHRRFYVYQVISKATIYPYDTGTRLASRKEGSAGVGSLGLCGLTNDRLNIECGWDTRIHISNLETGQVTAVSLQGRPVSLALMPGGEYLLVGDWSGHLYKVNITLNRIESIWHAHDDQVKRISLLKDSKFFATAGYDGHVKVWDGAEGCVLAETKLDSASLALSFIDEDHIMLSAYESCELSVWKWRSDTLAPLWSSKDDAIMSAVAMVPIDSTPKLTIAVGTQAGDLVWLTYPDGKQLKLMRSSHSAGILSLAYDPQENILASGDQKGFIVTYKVLSQQGGDI